METPNQIDLMAALNQFSGTERYYQHLSGYNYTDGVMFLAKTYGTFWLITEILVANHPEEIAEFQVWKLERAYKSAGEPTDAFTLTCEDGDYNLLLKKDIPFSDFKADNVELWYTNGVLYLPSEH